MERQGDDLPANISLDIKKLDLPVGSSNNVPNYYRDPYCTTFQDVDQVGILPV